MDYGTGKRLTKVHPELAKRVTQLIEVLLNLGMDVRAVQGFRTFGEQEKLFNQPRDGRDNDGDGRIDERDEKVTNARGGFSNHNYGLAVDLCPFKNNQPDWNDSRGFQTIGREAKALGLEWGGDWRFLDVPHVQLRGMSIKECLANYQKGGIERVWQRMYELLGGAKAETFIPAADDILEFGDKGAEVEKLQEKLTALNFLHSHEIDGTFGKITKNAVIGFQRQNRLTADGIVGPGTKSKLDAALNAQNPFQNLQNAELESAVVPALIPAKDIPTDLPADVKTESFQNLQNEQPPILENLPTTVSEKMTETFETAKGTIEKTTSATTEIFSPKNLPAFIPRFGKQWLLGLIPGFGFVSTIFAKLAAMPDWLVFLLGFFTGITIVLFVQMIIKYREKVVDFITKCYEITANPEMDNLIPTNADEFVGNRKNALLSALAPNAQSQ